MKKFGYKKHSKRGNKKRLREKNNGLNLGSVRQAIRSVRPISYYRVYDSVNGFVLGEALNSIHNKVEGITSFFHYMTEDAVRGFRWWDKSRKK